MKSVIALSIVAVLAATSSAQAGGFFAKRTNNILTQANGLIATAGDVVDVGGINVLNGNTVAVGNNSNILSGIGNGVLSGNANGNSVLNNVLNGNGILGIGGQNKRRGW